MAHTRSNSQANTNQPSQQSQTQPASTHRRTRSQSQGGLQKDTNSAKAKTDSTKVGLTRALIAQAQGKQVEEQVNETSGPSPPDLMPIDELDEGSATIGYGSRPNRTEPTCSADGKTLHKEDEAAPTDRRSNHVDDGSAALEKMKSVVEAQRAKRDRVTQDLTGVKRLFENGDHSKESEYQTLCEQYEDQKRVLASAEREYDELLLNHAESSHASASRIDSPRPTDIYAVPDDDKGLNPSNGTFEMQFKHCGGVVYDAYRYGPKGQERFEIRGGKKGGRPEIPYGDRPDMPKIPLRAENIEKIIWMTFKKMTPEETICYENWKTNAGRMARPVHRFFVRWPTEDGGVHSWEKRTTVEKHWKNYAEGEKRAKKTLTVKSPVRMGDIEVLKPGETISKLDYVAITTACQQYQRHVNWAKQQSAARRPGLERGKALKVEDEEF
ncbi:uncharacterized protein PV06_11470 [Exophiala oligosperma]|uniref:Uncharacterized protein n=1 Tax=Exophiala oligosperma TaxID=215243 RepID=A0A0D2DKH5_9EURO|nr:uncharacterized protein PV06_11470 [Exophiala oligosperma]KIW36249.1 hypothetical protein PV06_11470 [Exophiala oligosperma]